MSSSCRICREKIPNLKRKASRTDVGVAYDRARRIIDDAESDASEIRNQAETDAFERLQTVQEEAARILNDADEKAPFC